MVNNGRGENKARIRDWREGKKRQQRTRSRDKDLNQDALNAIDLITNEKDRAENIMIVDLIRNDLSKVCETGSIMVPEILKLESFLKVHHLTSVIRGKLKKDKNWIDLLKACWPGAL